MAESVDSAGTGFLSPDFKWVIQELLTKLSANDFKDLNRTELSKYRTRVIELFIREWRVTVRGGFYPLFRLLLPHRDPRQYNLKETTLIRSVCAMIGLPRKSEMELSLLAHKKDTKYQRLSEMLVNELSLRKLLSERGSNISIATLNMHLDGLSSRALGHRFGYQSLSKDESFLFFINNMSGRELTVLFDILLKQKILTGTLEKKLLNAFHSQAELYLSVVNDLKLLCDTLADPSKVLTSESKELQLKIGHAISPHLSKKIDSFKEIVGKMGPEPFYIEEKLDGERIQLHYSNYGSSITFFSRNGLDNSRFYGSSLEKGIIASHINLHPSVKDCILDGEMVTMDVVTQEILPFGVVKSGALKELKFTDTLSSQPSPSIPVENSPLQDSLSSFQQKTESLNNDYRPLFVVFDMLLLNDVSIIEYPLCKRKEYLEKVLTPTPGRIEINKYFEAHTEASIKTSLEHAIKVDAEGIIIKKKDSQYKIGARNDNWVKVKPEYLEYFGEEMDLLVMGRVPQKKPTYICGLRIPVKNVRAGGAADTQNMKSESPDVEEEYDETMKYKYISFCRISNGISKNEDELIKSRTKNKWINYSHQEPDMMEFGSETPFEWINPEDSFVLEVKARSINFGEQTKNKFKVGSTLTGGYAKNIRFDKDYRSCSTFQNFLSITQNSRNKNSHTLTKEFQTNRRKKRLGRKKFSLVDNDSEQKRTRIENNLFQGLCFYVLTDYVSEGHPKVSKAEICKRIASFGGKVISTISANANVSNIRVLSSKRTYECIHWIKQKYDVLNIEWIVDCLKHNRLLDLEPKYCFSVSRLLYKKSIKAIDRFCDSRQVETDKEMLQNCMEYYNAYHVPKKATNNYQDEIEDLKCLPIYMLYGVRVHIASENVPQLITAYLEKLVTMYGGETVLTMDDSNVIVVPCNSKGESYDDQNINTALQHVYSMVHKTELMSTANVPAVVTSQWLEECAKEAYMVDKAKYRVRGL